MNASFEAPILQGLITVSRWCNQRQRYLHAGELLYRREQSGEWLVGFQYDSGYHKNGLPALDPANLPIDIQQPRAVMPSIHGAVPHYFRQFLPGTVGHAHWLKARSDWASLTEVEQLVAVTRVRGEFGALYLNAQHVQGPDCVRTPAALQRVLGELGMGPDGGGSKPCQKVLGTQGRVASIPLEIRNDDGLRERYLAKVPPEGEIDEARVVAAMARTAKAAGIAVVDVRRLAIEGYPTLQLSRDYTRREENASSTSRNIYRYNRVSLGVLASAEATPDPGKSLPLSIAVRLLKQYSANPDADVSELYNRIIFDRITCHAANGLEHLELVDRGDGEWRLAPAFHFLPDVSARAGLALSPNPDLTTFDAQPLDVRFLKGAADACQLNHAQALKQATSVIGSVIKRLPSALQEVGVSDGDKNRLRQAVALRQGRAVLQQIGADVSAGPGMSM